MTFYIVATPIGNLKDITLRALEVLRSVKTILSEHSLTTAKLLRHYGIAGKLIDVHEPSLAKKLPQILRLLQQEGAVAFVSRAGTPGISDPGARLVALIVRHAPAVRIVPIPGPSAVSACLSVAGLPAERFCFLGFLPKKRHRRQLLQEIASVRVPAVLFESPYRLRKTLSDLQEAGILEVVICRELTKVHEEIFRGFVHGALLQWEKRVPRGEFVLIIPPRKKARSLSE